MELLIAFHEDAVSLLVCLGPTGAFSLLFSPRCAVEEDVWPAKHVGTSPLLRGSGWVMIAVFHLPHAEELGQKHIQHPVLSISSVLSGVMFREQQALGIPGTCRFSACQLRDRPC